MDTIKVLVIILKTLKENYPKEFDITIMNLNKKDIKDFKDEYDRN